MSKQKNTPCPPIDCPKDDKTLERAKDEMKQRYADELECIVEFHRYRYKTDCNTSTTHLEGCIQRFFHEWYWANKPHIPEILQAALQWISQKDPHDVCGLAKKLAETKKLDKNTSSNIEIAIASLILFFNDPEVITPYTLYVRLALGIDEKKCSPCCYPTYLKCFNTFKEKCCAQIKACLKSLLPYLQAAEVQFMKNIHDLNIVMDICAIRKNRMADKILWVRGEQIRKAMQPAYPSQTGSQKSGKK